MVTTPPETAALGWQGLAPTSQTPEITYVWVSRITDDEIVEIGLPTDGRGGPATTWCDSCGPPNRLLIQPTDNEYS